MESLICFLIPRYLYLKIAEQDRVMRREFQWPFLFDTALASGVLLIVARLLAWLPIVLLSAEKTQSLSGLWDRVMPFHYSFTIALATVIGVISGLKFPKIWEKIFGIQGADPFNSRLSDLIGREDQGKRVMLELSNGKIYIGSLLECSLEEFHKEKIVAIAPYSSGHRDPGTQHLSINTFYNFSGSDRIEITIPYREVASLRLFKESFFLECVKKGLVNLEAQLPPDPPAKTE